MTDIVERLRHEPLGDYGLQLWAADEIERLRSENKRLEDLVFEMQCDLKEVGARHD